jgi:drug/metabolite transporter (DMT)-like permease
MNHNNTNHHHTKNSLLLLLAAIIWGFAFVAQQVGMDYIGPFTFNAIRNMIGALVLLPCIAFLDKKSESETEHPEETAALRSWKNPALLTGGIACGVILFLATSFQQFGIQYTTVGKAGFITAFYIIIVPILGIFLKKKTGLNVWIGVFLALIGLYLLCITESFTISRGDFLVLCCAFIFSLHILVIDHFSPLVDGVKMSCIQFFVCGILSWIAMLLTETVHISDILAAWIPIAYAGVLSCGVAYTLQIVGQKNMNPTAASLILSLESVFSVLGGFLILHQMLSVRELVGCLFLFTAIVLSQLPPIGKKKETT